MKNISSFQQLFIFLFIVLISSNIIAQNIFQKEYSTGTNRPYLIDTLSDGYLVVGTTNVQTAGGLDGFAMKIDFEGNPVWEKSYGGTADEEIYSMYRTHNDHFVIAGITKSFVDSSSDSINIYLIEIDTLGSVIWSKSISSGYYAEANSVQETFDHGFIIAGDIQTSDTSRLSAYLLKLDSLRNIEWCQVYKDSLNNSSVAAAVIQTNDRGYAITGYSLSYSPFFNYDMFITQTDSIGNVYRSSQYSFEDTNQFNYPSVFGFDIIQNVSGNLVVTGGVGGSFSASSTNIYQWLLMEVDTAGTIVYSKSFFLNSGECKANSIQQTPDGGYILGGYMGNYYLAMLKTDATINTEWCYHYDIAFNPTAFGNRARYTSDNGFILSGALIAGNKLRIVKTRSDGTSGCAETVPVGPGGASADVSLPSIILPWTSVNKADTIPAPTVTNVINISTNTICLNVSIDESPENNFLKLYPNPASGILTIVSEHTEKISISNLLGEVVIEKEFLFVEGEKIELDISRLLQGVYLLKSGNIVRKFVKE